MIDAARLRTATRFLLRSMELRASHFLLALLSISVGVSIVAMAFDLRADLGQKMSHELRSYGPNIIVSPAAGGGASSGNLMLDEAVARSLLRAAGEGSSVVSCPILYASGRASAGSKAEGVSIAGLDLAAARVLFPYWKVEETADWKRSCLVGARLARRLDLEPGGLLSLQLGASAPAGLAVAGLVSTGEAEEDQVFVPLRLLQDLAGYPGRVSVVAARVEGGAGPVGEFVKRVDASGSGLQARPLRQVAAAEGVLLGRLDLMMALLGGMILALSSLCVMTTLMAAVVQREGEIGLMRSLGAGDGEILLMLLGEVSLLGAAGGMIGYNLGVLEARFLGSRLFGAAISPRIEILPAVTAVAIALCWVSVIIPLRRALAIEPARVLRGE